MFGNKKSSGGYGFREKLARFMSGRNGADALYRFLLFVWAIVFVVALICRAAGWGLAYSILSALVLLLMIWQLFRCFSRNTYARQKENRRYLLIRDRVRNFFRLLKNQFRDRKTHVYRPCPSCRNTLRLPRQKGEHTVQCPVCHNRFTVHI